MARVRGKSFDVKMPDGTKERYDEKDWHKDECPRCGGEHSWCQNVQPGEYGGK